MIFNKKAGMFDIFIAIILSITLVIALVLFTYSNTLINSKLLEQAPSLERNLPAGTNVTKMINDSMDKVTLSYSQFKWISVALIFVYFLCVLLSAYLVKTHPAWFIAYIMICILATIISAYLSNAYETMMITPYFATTWADFVGANYVFLYLPYWIAVISLIAGALMYINLDTGGYQ